LEILKFHHQSFKGSYKIGSTITVLKGHRVVKQKSAR